MPAWVLPVTEHTTVLYAIRGVSELIRLTPESVFAKYGLTPKQYPDFAALRGDPSDNLPKIPGVGNLNPDLLKALREAATDASADGVEFLGDVVPGLAVRHRLSGGGAFGVHHARPEGHHGP
ncbi:hypothetical protein ACFQ1S_26220 [Kibdelosporangium lantanae]|uniref:Uncharacterized protein n=1 Tax=Kibdelosporangium lantanae TaxID=1497396 RepID=A0ABW3MFF5_9PSEU